MKPIFPIALALLAAAPPALAEDLQAILSRMDVSAAAFRSAQADMRRVTHTAIINDDSEELGRLLMMKAKGGVRALIEFTKPDPRSIAFRDNKVEVYYPKIQTVQEIDLRKQKGIVEEFLLLGFGSSGKDLNKSYSIRIAGEESVDGQASTRLELIPKLGKAKEYFTKAELWIPHGASHSVRQKLYQPSGDTITIYYTNVKLNPGLTEKAVSLVLPANVKREFPQK
jgi:outer membrane lipoprotein-sorting protein